MSGGRFLVGLKEATSLEKIIKFKTLLKDDVNISNIIESSVEHDQNIETLLHHVDLSRCLDEMVILSEDSREIGIYITGYVAKKLKECFADCCSGLLTGDSGDENPNFSVCSNFIERRSYNSINNFGKLCMYVLLNSKICG